MDVIVTGRQGGKTARLVSDNGRWPHLREIGWHCDWWGGQCWCGDIHTSYAAVKLNGGTDRDARMPR